MSVDDGQTQEGYKNWHVKVPTVAADDSDLSRAEKRAAFLAGVNGALNAADIHLVADVRTTLRSAKKTLVGFPGRAAEGAVRVVRGNAVDRFPVRTERAAPLIPETKPFTAEDFKKAVDDEIKVLASKSEPPIHLNKFYMKGLLDSVYPYFVTPIPEAATTDPSVRDSAPATVFNQEQFLNNVKKQTTVVDACSKVTPLLLEAFINVRMAHPAESPAPLNPTVPRQEPSAWQKKLGALAEINQKINDPNSDFWSSALDILIPPPQVVKPNSAASPVEKAKAAKAAEAELAVFTAERAAVVKVLQNYDTTLNGPIRALTERLGKEQAAAEKKASEASWHPQTDVLAAIYGENNKTLPPKRRLISIRPFTKEEPAVTLASLFPSDGELLSSLEGVALPNRPISESIKLAQNYEKAEIAETQLITSLLQYITEKGVVKDANGKESQVYYEPELVADIQDKVILAGIGDASEVKAIANILDSKFPIEVGQDKFKKPIKISLSAYFIEQVKIRMMATLAQLNSDLDPEVPRRVQYTDIQKIEFVHKRQFVQSRLDSLGTLLANHRILAEGRKNSENYKRLLQAYRAMLGLADKSAIEIATQLLGPKAKTVDIQKSANGVAAKYIDGMLKLIDDKKSGEQATLNGRISEAKKALPTKETKKAPTVAPAIPGFGPSTGRSPGAGIFGKRPG